MAMEPIAGVSGATEAAIPVEPVQPVAARAGQAGMSAPSTSPVTPPLLGSGGAPAATGVAGTPTPAQTHAAVAAANKQLGQDGREFSFHYDDQVHQEIVKIIDTQTQQVLQQIPSEAMLAAARALASGSTSGLLLKTKV